MKTIYPPPQLLLPRDLDLRTVSRWPTTLSPATEAAINRLPVQWHRLSADALECGGMPPLSKAESHTLTYAPAALQSEGEPSHSKAQRHRLEADATIILLTHNNLVFTRLCIESLLPHTTEIDYELIIVDNNSTDGTREYLQSLSEATNSSSPTTGHRPPTTLLFNEQNLGFAKACNQGLVLASGKNLVLLNNDTILPPCWLSRLLAWLEDDRVGLVGPVANRSGNESQIHTTYNTLAEFLEFSANYSARHCGESFDIRVATMFCVAMRREVYRKVGPLDEQFELALFEDDDYSMRIRQHGLAVKCVEDVCIHHFGQASVGRLEGRYGELFHANRRRWEAKWNLGWQPYTMRHKPDYEILTARIAEVTAQVIPGNCPTLVLSKGDDLLLAAIGRHARHFPQDRAGRYSGYNPADSAAAIDHLEFLRAAGAFYLVIPATALWWLDHYAGFADHLRGHFQVLYEQSNDCLIFSLV